MGKCLRERFICSNCCMFLADINKNLPISEINTLNIAFENLKI